MKKFLQIIIRVVLFAVIFAGTALIVNLIYMRSGSSSMSEMSGSVLPEISFSVGGREVCRTPGYLSSISAGLMKECEVPLGSDNSVSVILPSDDDYADAISYELRDPATDNLIENGTVTDAAGASVNIPLRMNITPDKDYSLIIELGSDRKDPLFYYVKVLRPGRDYVSSMLDYAEAFHELTFRNEGAGEGLIPDVDVSTAGDALRPVTSDDIAEIFSSNSKTSGYDYGQVDMQSSYDEVTWGSLNPERVTKAVPRIRELFQDGAVIEMAYIMKSHDDKEETYYRTREVYRLSYDASLGRPVLMDYVRTAEEIISGRSIESSVNGISLGINSTDMIEMKSSDNMYFTAYEAAGSLWIYDYKSARQDLAYEYLSVDSPDERLLDSPCGIRIMTVTDDGNVTFAVYGRMGRGRHEGRNGICIYSYDTHKLELTEIMFVETGIPYDMLSVEAARFMYYDEEGGVFYTFMNNEMVALGTGRRSAESLAEGIPASDFHVSKSGDVIVFPDSSDPESVTSVTVRNFKEGIENTFSADGMQLSILGFTDEDPVIGAAAKENAAVGADGKADFKLSAIYILDTEGNIRDVYEKSGRLITDYVIEDGKITVSKTATWGDASRDHITHNNANALKDPSVVSLDEAYKRRVLAISFPQDSRNVYVVYEPGVMASIASENTESMYFIDYKTPPGRYFIYRGGGIVSADMSCGSAIKKAQEIGGTVSDSSGRTVYDGKDPLSYHTIAGRFRYVSAASEEESYVSCLEASMNAAGLSYIGSGISIEPESDWEDTFTDISGGNVSGLNISGISLDTAMYYISEGSPVTAKADGRYVLIVSYNNKYIRYYDPVKGEEEKVSRKTFTKSVQESGNELYTYVP